MDKPDTIKFEQRENDYLLIKAFPHYADKITIVPQYFVVTGIEDINRYYNTSIINEVEYMWLKEQLEENE